MSEGTSHTVALYWIKLRETMLAVHSVAKPGSLLHYLGFFENDLNSKFWADVWTRISWNRA